MKIRLNTLLAGPDGIIQPGDIVDLPEEKALALLESGYAVKLGGAIIETAEAKPAVETAEATPVRKKR